MHITQEGHVWSITLQSGMAILFHILKLNYIYTS